MQEKSYSKKLYSEKTLEDESISLLEWDSLKTHLSSFASTEMGKRAILSFGIPSEYESSKRLLKETGLRCFMFLLKGFNRMFDSFFLYGREKLF